ncbi:polysaccharide deacetylase family protein [Paenibacillus oleatilyticus]|uniref:polysaccharide deacetylase family protein n=1 Tax=Paenibacillus oleatilyticus TaxID=2594886 RepID=UPI001C200608|nr:polysaccharide deacetylase family protein [Paenibacillus oleatilyticus]MBU7319425.1 polysaccharide deacetylase [Paenibacillus oleatilyticus]
MSLKDRKGISIFCCLAWFTLCVLTGCSPEKGELRTSAGQKHIAGKSSYDEEERVLSGFQMIAEYAAKPYAILGTDPPSTERGSRKKKAYLTFDDGPSRQTRHILRILREKGVKATFFVTGKSSPELKSYYKLIVNEGHSLGNHTYSHNYGYIYSSIAAYRKDTEKLNDLLARTVGVRPDIFRFPGGSDNHLSRKAGGRHIMAKIAREMTNIGYQYFDWNVSSTDAAAVTLPKQDILASVRSNSRGKNQIIVLMHDDDHKTTTVEALPDAIDWLKKQEYKFETLSKSSFVFQFLHPPG